MKPVEQFRTNGVRLDYETEARDLAASVLILASVLIEWDGESETTAPLILNAALEHAKRIIDSPTESRIFVP